MQYRQVAMRLRVQRGPGNPDLVSERPHTKDAEGNPIYQDEDEPTLITFDVDCQVDIEKLLKQGAIVPHTARRKPAPKEPANGETSGE